MFASAFLRRSSALLAEHLRPRSRTQIYAGQLLRKMPASCEPRLAGRRTNLSARRISESSESMSTFPRNPKAAPVKPVQPRYGRMDVGLGQVKEAIAGATEWLLGLQHPDGYWCGELEADSMLESDYIFMHTLLGTGDRGKMERAVNEILR